MELSSYQLETAPEISPNIGIWTNLTPDHLERHGNIQAYSNISKLGTSDFFDSDIQQIRGFKHESDTS